MIILVIINVPPTRSVEYSCIILSFVFRDMLIYSRFLCRLKSKHNATQYVSSVASWELLSSLAKIYPTWLERKCSGTRWCIKLLFTSTYFTYLTDDFFFFFFTILLIQEWRRLWFSLSLSVLLRLLRLTFGYKTTASWDWSNGARVVWDLETQEGLCGES